MHHIIAKKFQDIRLIVLGFIFLFGCVSFVYAATHNMTGFGWSSNIGWVDMAGVVYDDATDGISGYGWSEHIGWVRFGEFSDCPTGSSVAECESRLDTSGTEAKIVGWARACSALEGDTCGETAPVGYTERTIISSQMANCAPVSDETMYENPQNCDLRVGPLFGSLTCTGWLGDASCSGVVSKGYVSSQPGVVTREDLQNCSGAQTAEYILENRHLCNSSNYLFSDVGGTLQCAGFEGTACSADLDFAAASLDGTGALVADGGDWDGWISLSCENEPGQNCGAGGSTDYGWVVADDGEVTGYAWGGGGDNQVIGWLQSTSLNSTVTIGTSFGVSLSLYTADGSTQVTDGSLVAPGIHQLQWDISSATNCVLSGTDTSVDAVDAYAVSQTNVSIAEGANTFTLTCDDGETDTVAVVGAALPQIDLRPIVNGSEMTPDTSGATPSITINTDNGDTLGMDWDVTYDSGDSVTCAAQGAGFSVGSVTTEGPDASVTPPAMDASGVYAIRCTGLAGQAIESILVTNGLGGSGGTGISLTAPTIVNLSNDPNVEITWDVTGYPDGTCTLAGPGLPGGSITLDGTTYTTPTGSLTAFEIFGESTFILTCGSESVRRTIRTSGQFGET